MDEFLKRFGENVDVSIYKIGVKNTTFKRYVAFFRKGMENAIEYNENMDIPVFWDGNSHVKITADNIEEYYQKSFSK